MTVIVRRFLSCAIFAGIAALGAAGIGWGQDEPRPSPRSVVLLAAIEGPIGPAMDRHVRKVVEQAGERNAEALVLRINTPGGLVTTMRTIVSTIVDSPVPVIGYVAPSGAHAASAGTFILYATHIAAMAPGTNVGAATPVQMGGFPGTPSPGERKPPDGDGEDAKKDAAPSPDAAMKKAVNDAVAFIRSLADLRDRNADWAEKAVREGDSLAARAAMEMRVIDLLARDVDALLAAVDGRTVTVAGTERTLSTRGIPVERVDPDFMTRALGVVSNPNLAFILLMIGVYGLIFEFINPGTIGPGVIGFICLVLGLYALNQLPLNYAGLALLLVGIAFMVAEAFTPTFGVLGLGGVAAFVIGAAMLVDTDVPAYQISWWTIGGVAAASAGVLIFLVGYLWKVYRRPETADGGRVVGAEGRVLDWSNGEGHVWAAGERWRARGESSLDEGASVHIRDMDGLTLVVARSSGAGPELAPAPPEGKDG
jgi:membrane-bound serine protease (ClpP class)